MLLALMGTLEKGKGIGYEKPLRPLQIYKNLYQGGKSVSNSKLTFELAL